MQTVTVCIAWQLEDPSRVEARRYCQPGTVRLKPSFVEAENFWEALAGSEGRLRNLEKGANSHDFSFLRE